MLSKNGSGLDFQGQTIVFPLVVGYTKLPGPLNSLSAINLNSSHSVVGEVDEHVLFMVNCN